MSLEDCLPSQLRTPSATITRIAAGLSGAGVYRVDAAGQTFVLKVAGEGESLAGWQRQLHIRRLAADAGLAPRVVHSDEARRAVLSAFVADRSFPTFYLDPRTHEAALAQLGRTLRRVHDLPIPPSPPASDAEGPRQFLAASWTALAASGAVPAFVGDAVERVLAEREPPRDRAAVLSHNDVNPSNLVYDGQNILLLDWERAGANDPYYDLATISVFLLMDGGACQRLLAAYDGATVAGLPPRVAYSRRFVAALCGVIILTKAREGGHPGATGDETLAATPALGELYQRMRSGALSPASAEGLWWFGLALAKTSLAL